MASASSRFRRSKGTTGSAGVAVGTGTLLAAKPPEAGWEVMSGEDVENSAVLEQHRFGLQMSLLGQGTPEGFVDHEFPAQTRSIDGLEGPPVRRGQEALMQLLTAPERDDEEEEEDVSMDAPRCPCGRRGRQGRVQVNGMVAKRPYFRCANRSCRFFSFGELASSPEAQSLPWMRLRTSQTSSQLRGPTMSQSLVVVGRDGFRPEDSRLGPKSEALGDVLFLEAVAVLAERPSTLDKLLPNSGTASGCHEVRLCVAGLWRSYLIDERFPMLQANSKNPHESLAFGRSAGNQLWIPLLEKAYAKAYAAYQFAFPAPLKILLEELTGAVVEQIRLGATSWSTRGRPFDAEELWTFLSSQVTNGALVACYARSLPPGCSSVFPILEIGTGGHSARLIRLRNPRISGSLSASTYETALLLLRGRSAEASTYADGSFWITYEDFMSCFSQLYVCHAASAGGALKHTRTFEGDFTSPSDGLGTRGCTLHVTTLSSCDLWITCMQPIPKGTRLLQPCMGHVLNDLGIIVLDRNQDQPRAVCFGGATGSLTCHISLAANEALLIFPVSFRGWPGAVRLRLHCSEALCVKEAQQSHDPAEPVWGKLWGLAADFGPELLGEHSQCVRRQVPVRGEDGVSLASTELLILRMEAATLLILENPDDTEAFIFDGTVEGNYVVTHTARGAQQGDWCEDKNEDSFSVGTRSHWRRYNVEDIVPPASRQLVSMHFAVNLADWDVEVLFAKVTLAPKSLVGSRPRQHPFAPHPIPSSLNCAGKAGYKNPVKMVETQSNNLPDRTGVDEDLEVQLALAMSLEDLGPKSLSEAEVSTRRWARRKAPMCAVCTEPMMEALPCCGKACATCASHWAVEQESQGLAFDEISCPFCARSLASLDGSVLARFLGKDALERSQQRLKLREAQLSKLKANPTSRPLTVPAPEDSGLPSRVLTQLGLKQCPGCGEGMQKESETCHKMICRVCRARFCFRCLARLEYFNCGCTGAEHNFVDPLDGTIRSHQ